MRKVWSWGCLAATVLVSGCNSPHLAISGEAATVPAGSSKAFQALAQDSDGQITWTLSGPGSLDLTTGPQVTYSAPATYDPAGQHSATITVQLSDAADETRKIAITITQPSTSIGGIPGLNTNVTVTYDERDIPTITCIETTDCYAVLGYIHARDRFFEMDFFRRAARGKLSELVGEAALAQDQAIRTVFTTRTGDPLPEALTTYLQSDSFVAPRIAAYTNGVNAWLSAMRNDSTLLPAAYGQLQFTITNSKTDIPDWSDVDSVGVARLFQFQLSEDIEKEADYGRWAQTFASNPVAVGVWIQARSPLSSYTLAGTGAPNAPSLVAAPETLANLKSAAGALRSAQAFLRPLSALREKMGGPAGSNNWVVDGDHSATGQAMVANDPHLPLNYPSNFHLSHLVGTKDGLNVMGAIFPGLPATLIGRGSHVGWGVTVVGYDVTDLYVEQLVFQGGQPVAVMFKGNPVPFHPVTQSIGVRGTVGIEQRDFQVVVVPHHGPVISLDAAGGTAITARWTGQETATDDIRAFFRLNNAASVDDAQIALEGNEAKPDGGIYTGYYTGAQNFVLADDQGNIGFVPHACVPQRPWAASNAIYPYPVVPVPGTGGFEWATGPDGGVLCVANDKLPRAIGSDKGYLATANADPVGATADNDPYSGNQGTIPYVSFDWDDLGFRIARIQEVLDAKTANGGKVSLDDIHALQADHIAIVARPFLQVFQALHLTESTDANVAAAATMLAAWGTSDGGTPLDCPTGLVADALDPVTAQNDPDPRHSSDSASCLLFHTFLRRVLDTTFSDEVAAAGISRNAGHEVRALLTLLSGAVPTTGNPLCSDVDADGAKVTDRNCPTQVTNALAWAWTRLNSVYGATSNWRWGRVHTLTFAFVVSGYPLIDPTFQPGPFPRPGGAWTVDVGAPSPSVSNDLSFPYRSGGNVRWAASMDGTLANTTNQLPGVENGGPFSGSPSSMLSQWVTNTYFSWPYQPSDVSAAALRTETFNP